MDADAYLALLQAAGAPGGLRASDRWVADRLAVSERQAREWRLTGKAPQRTVLALKGIASERGA